MEKHSSSVLAETGSGDDLPAIREVEIFVEEWDQLLRSITRARGRLSQLAPPARLGPSHYWIMRTISENQPCRLTDVARTVGLSVAGASQMVRTLERRGLLSCGSDKSDGRALMLRMTPKGDAALAQRAEEAWTRIRYLSKRLTPQERSAAIKLLPRLREIIEEIDVDGGQPHTYRLKAHPAD